MSDPGASTGSVSLSPGTTLGHYEIVALIGSGGMGQVYRARDTKLQRDVALKLLPTEATADPERRQRFEREARAVAALNHPHIVTIHSVEDVDGRVFLTMELVNGRPLSELIPRGGLPLDRLLKIAVPLADAVSAAHARGITHRDLKPANVMVTAEGSVKVLDFGLAKQHDTAAQADRIETRGADIITGQGRILGTVAYMAPEQAEGKQTDARSDIFSLGVVLYEMATGERPFSGETSLSTLTAIMRDTPRPVTDINPAIPKELGRVIRRALVKDPDRRQQIGKDLRNELDEIRQELESGELVAQTARAAAAAATPPRRVPWVALAGGVLVLAAIAAALAWSRRGASETAVIGSDPIAVTVSTVTAEDGDENFPSLSADGKWLIYSADPEDTGADILLRAVGGQTAINLTKDSPGTDTQAVFSPDGERIAFRSARDNGGLFIMGRTGESVRRLTTDGFNPSWSPDGSAIVYATESAEFNPGNRAARSVLWTVSTTKGERRQLTTTDAMQPAWSPHGHRIAYWGLFGDSVQRDIWTVPAGGGEPVRVTNDPAIDWSPAWSPDGHFLYFVSDRSGAFNLWRVPIDEATGRTALPATPTAQPRDSSSTPSPRERIRTWGQAACNRSGCPTAAECSIPTDRGSC
jgi:Tol biopolymer transport system component/tRNA A-37 threonylcarbamoyl transferase component Bud32